MSSIQALGYVQFPTHRVHVSKDLDSDRIYCFKSTLTRCDFASFDSEGEACDYILAPMPTIGYQLILNGESPE